MSKKFAIVKGDTVDGIALAESPIPSDGEWIDIEGISPEPGPMWTYRDGVFAPPHVPSNNLVEPPKVISKLAFRYRFTNAEFAAILGAAKTDVEVQVWYDTFNLLTVVNLDDQRTKDGVADLVSKNLLTQARADEILTAPVQPNEMV
ncbi:hypothetical protein EBT25_19320 [bacterium]|nr:hypothetical protein [bacterium]